MFVDHVEGNTSRPLLILVESAGPDVAQPAADSLTDGDVKFVPAPLGYTTLPPPAPPTARASPAASPRSKWLDPAKVSGVTTSVRNTAHGAKEFLGFVNPPAAVSPAV